MASQRGSGGEDERERGSGRIWVGEGEDRRPFMRGILIHSLMARGVSFEDAYSTAEALRDRFRGRQGVPREEITKAARELLGDEPFQEDSRIALPLDIHVTGRGSRRPFSKGILSQSLLAAAIDPNQAFEVAREIERQLVASGSRKVRRRELRSLAYETLQREVGQKTAARYLVWRRHQEPERPVIILLGGASGVGKTSLALEVAHRLGIGRVLSTDSIRQIMRIMLSPELVPAIHASSFDAHRLLPPESVVEDPVVEGFRAQASTVAVGVRASIDRAVDENVSLVLDGVSIVPGLIDLDAYADVADVFLFVVATLDEKAIRSRYTARASEASRRAAQDYLDNLDGIMKIQEHFLELADRYGVPIVDNVSLDRSVVFIIRHVTETLRKHGPRNASELL